MFRILILVVLYTTFATPAYAYIDAGLGALVLQSLVAGFFTIMVLWRNWIDKTKAFFFRKKKKSDS